MTPWWSEGRKDGGKILKSERDGSSKLISVSWVQKSRNLSSSPASLFPYWHCPCYLDQTWKKPWFQKLATQILCTTTAYYNIIIRKTVRKCLPVWFQCLCVSAKPPPHNTPTHMARDGWRQSDSWVALCRPNNAETHCCPWVKEALRLLPGENTDTTLFKLIDFYCAECWEKDNLLMLHGSSFSPAKLHNLSKIKIEVAERSLLLFFPSQLNRKGGGILHGFPASTVLATVLHQIYSNNAKWKPFSSYNF